MKFCTLPHLLTLSDCLLGVPSLKGKATSFLFCVSDPNPTIYIYIFNALAPVPFYGDHSGLQGSDWLGSVIITAVSSREKENVETWFLQAGAWVVATFSIWFPISCTSLLC